MARIEATTVRSVEGDTVESIVWERYGTIGREHSALLAHVLTRDENEGLAAHGLTLPRGTIVFLPAYEVIGEDAAVTRRAQELYDR